MWLLRIRNFQQELSQKKLKKSPDLIFNFLRLQENYGTKKPPGRPPNLPKRDKTAIIKRVNNEKITFGELTTRDPQIKVSKSTLSRIVNSSKVLKHKKRKPQPRMTKTPQQNRLDWAKDRMSWKSE